MSALLSKLVWCPCGCPKVCIRGPAGVQSTTATNIPVSVQTRQHSLMELTLLSSQCYLYFTHDEIKSLRGRICQMLKARKGRTLILNPALLLQAPSSFVPGRSTSLEATQVLHSLCSSFLLFWNAPTPLPWSVSSPSLVWYSAEASPSSETSTHPSPCLCTLHSLMYLCCYTSLMVL